MKLLALSGSTILLWGASGCGPEARDFTDQLCSSTLAPQSAVPSEGATDIALDVHPSLLFQANNGDCPLADTTLFGDTELALVVDGKEVEGKVVGNADGQSGIITFVPASPLVPGSYYTLHLGSFVSRFATGTDPQSPPPSDVSIKSIAATSLSKSDQSVTIVAVAPADAQEWIHLILTDEKGLPIAPATQNVLEFLVPASQPTAAARGFFGFGKGSQICFVAHSENLSGMSSVSSKPVCTHAK